MPVMSCDVILFLFVLFTVIFLFLGEKCPETEIKYLFSYTSREGNRMIFSKGEQAKIRF